MRLKDKAFFRCNVCNDVHIGYNPPKICPTCSRPDAYLKIDQKELFSLLGIIKDDIDSFDKKDILESWKEFSGQNDFSLNPDRSHVDMIIQGVLKNQEDYGLKLCPCRIREDSGNNDLELICPCNFKSQETWAKKGMCWCGLFIKDKKDEK